MDNRTKLEQALQQINLEHKGISVRPDRSAEARIKPDPDVPIYAVVRVNSDGDIVLLLCDRTSRERQVEFESGDFPVSAFEGRIREFLGMEGA